MYRIALVAYFILTPCILISPGCVTAPDGGLKYTSDKCDYWLDGKWEDVHVYQNDYDMLRLQCTSGGADAVKGCYAYGTIPTCKEHRSKKSPKSTPVEELHRLREEIIKLQKAQQQNNTSEPPSNINISIDSNNTDLQ